MNFFDYILYMKRLGKAKANAPEPKAKPEKLKVLKTKPMRVVGERKVTL